MVNNGHKTVILSFKNTFFRACSFLKPHVLFYTTDLAIWHGFPDITHIEADNDPKSAIWNLSGHITPPPPHPGNRSIVMVKLSGPVSQILNIV